MADDTGEKKNYTIHYFLEVAELPSGASFGELALMNSKPRAATIYCKAETHFATLCKADFQSIVQKAKIKKRNRLIEFLKSFKIMSHLTKITLEKLTYYLEEKNYLMG
jgi:CRP-like cAMP-binding protein